MPDKSSRGIIELTRIKLTLLDVLEELRVSKNQFSVRSGIRPATIIAWCNNKAKHIDLVTLQIILDTINELSKEYKMNKTYTIEDLITYTPKK